jgi:hypothetical protein
MNHKSINKNKRKKDSFIVHWNINGFYNNIDELNILCDSYEPLILCLNETHHNENDKLFMKNYTTYSKIGTRDNHAKSCGGVAMFIKDNLPHKYIELNTEIQIVAVQIKFPLKCTVISIYQRPTENIENKELTRIILSLPPPYIIVGDFNAHHVGWFSNFTNKNGENLFNTINSLNLILLNENVPTRYGGMNKDSVIDLAFISPIILNQINIKVHEEHTTSDHAPLILNTECNKSASKRQIRFNYNKIDMQLFTKQLNLENINMNDDINNINDEIINRFHSALYQSCPLFNNTYRPCRCKSWWSNEIKEERKTRNRLKSIKYRTNKVEDIAAYRVQRAKVKHLIQQAKDVEAERKCQEFINDPFRKKIWNMISNIDGGKSLKKSYHFTSNNNKILSREEEIAEELSEFFEKNMQNQNIPDKTYFVKTDDKHKRMYFQEEMDNLLTLKELEFAIKNMKISSPGDDQIRIDLFKNLTPSQKIVILDFFNKIWKSSHSPAQWKVGIIIPLYKNKGKIDSVDSYRPIQLLPVMSKIMDKMIARRLDFFIENNVLLCQEQSGFRKKRSTVDNLLAVETTIKKALEKKNEVILINFDISKAYDSINHKLLVELIQKMGIPKRMCSFIQDFLKQRKFKVRFGQHFSSLKHSISGTPQGSGLSVILFNIMMNSIDNYIHDSNFHLFADDLLILFEIEKENDKNFINQTLKSLEKWSKYTGLTFAEEKTHFVKFSNKHVVNRTTINEMKLNNVYIQEKESSKILGVTFDNRLKFNQHVNNVIKSTRRDIDLLRWLSGSEYNIHRDTLIMVLNAKLRSKLGTAIKFFTILRNLEKEN